MASLLGEYLNTYQRANPAQGLMQGFQTGSNFMFALNQQKMQQEQMKQQEAEREKQSDMKMVSVLFEQASKSHSKSLRAQYTQRAHDYLKKYDPMFDATVDPNEESFNQYVSKVRKFAKPLVENPDEGLKDLKAFIVEMAEAQDQGLIDEKQYKQVVDEASAVKKEAAGELGGLVINPEQFRSDPAYQTPEAKAGIQGYQDQLLSQVTALGEGGLANQITDNLQKKNSEKQTRAVTPNQVASDFNRHVSAIVSLQKSIGSYKAKFDPFTGEPVDPKIAKESIEKLETEIVGEMDYLKRYHPEKTRVRFKNKLEKPEAKAAADLPKEARAEVIAAKGAIVTFKNGRKFKLEKGIVVEVK